MASGLTPSSSNSGIFFQGDDESQSFINSHFTSSYGNSSNSVPGCGGPSYHNLSMVSGGEIHNPVMMNVSTPGPSASSLATDANSGLSGGGPHNNESYIRLPASPMSFEAGSSVVDGANAVQQRSSHHDPSVQLGGSSATSLPTSQSNHIPLSIGRRVASESFFQGPSQAWKKPRLVSKQDDALQQQMLRQWLQRQEILQQQQQEQNPQYQLLLQQQKMRQQQQYLQSLPPLHRLQLQQQQQQQQQQQGMRLQIPGGPRPYENGVCARRLMQYLYHQRQRPSESSIVYWRKFVAEYFSPRAKKRWCFSNYDNAGHNALGDSPQTATGEWKCDLCGLQSRRGSEETFDILPRLIDIKFSSGVLDELLYLGMPSERRVGSGMMMLEYEKAVQESVYEHMRVVHEGHLRIIFSQDLKILSWEFCTRRHEELIPRRLLAPQVNQLLQVAEKCQSTIDQSGSEGINPQDLQTNSNMVMATGRQLAKVFDSHSLNDVGFSKRYVRCLQISEVVSSMKDMFDLCHNQKVGPIDALKSYLYRMRTGKLQMQEMEQSQQPNVDQGLPPDRNSLNKLMPFRNSGVNIPTNNMVGQGSVPGSAQAGAFAISNYQTFLMKQNHPNNTTVQKEPPRNSIPSPSYQRNSLLSSGFAQGPPISGVGVSSRLSPNPQIPSSCYNNSTQQQPLRSSSNQNLEQQTINRIWQNLAINSNENSGQQQSLSGQSSGRNRTDNGPSTSNRHRAGKGLDQSQNQKGMVSSNTPLSFEDEFLRSEVDDDDWLNSYLA